MPKRTIISLTAGVFLLIPVIICRRSVFLADIYACHIYPVMFCGSAGTVAPAGKSHYVTDGTLRLIHHSPNGPSGMERAKIFLLEDTGESLRIVEPEIPERHLD